jgi:hypothetical protein
MKCIAESVSKYNWNLTFIRRKFFAKHFVAIKTSNLHPNIKAFRLYFRVIEEGKHMKAAFTLERRSDSEYVYCYFENSSRIFLKPT